jgi:hypothetical protein
MTKTTTPIDRLHALHLFPVGERVVSMIETHGRVLIATELAVYELRSAFEEVETPEEPEFAEVEPGFEDIAATESEREAELLAKARAIVENAPPKRSPRMQAALDSAYETITEAATAPPVITTPAHARGAAWAELRGWKRVRGRVPAGAQRKEFGGVKMWRKR